MTGPAGEAKPAEGGKPPVHRFMRPGMGAVFEVSIAGQDAEYARQAAWAALDEMDRLEAELSRFRPASDVSRISGLAAGQSVRVGAATMECLQLAAKVGAETGGAFDVTIGRLYALWVSNNGPRPEPSAAELAAARRCTGMSNLAIDEADRSVGVRSDGVSVDLGGIGKGFALDRMVEILRDWGITSALVNGGQSSVRAIGSAPAGTGWSVGLRDPEKEGASIGSVRLKDRALSASSLPKGKPHIIDPRTGRPASTNLGSWAAAGSAALSDALSTAFFVLSPAEVEQYCGQHPDVSGMLVVNDAGGRKVLRYGKWDM